MDACNYQWWTFTCLRCGYQHHGYFIPDTTEESKRKCIKCSGNRFTLSGLGLFVPFHERTVRKCKYQIKISLKTGT